MCASHDATAQAAEVASSPAIEPDPGEPLDVCLLSYRSDPYSGGQGVYVYHLSRALAALGHSVDVISGRPYPELDPRVNLIELPGANVFEAESNLTAFEPSFLRSPTKLYEWTSALTGGFPEPYAFGRRVVRYFEEHDPDYDVVHDNQSLSYGLVELMDRGHPTVATVHHPITVDRELALEHADGLTSRVLVRRWFRFLKMQEAVARELPHVIAVSRASKQRTVEDFGIDAESATVIHNGIDTERYQPRECERLPRRIATTISSDVPLKGLSYLLRAFARVREEAPDAELLVMGDLRDDGPTGDLISELGVDDAIDCRRRIDDDEMVELYASSAMAVVPSLYEGFGLPAAEAMACGVPVVATTGGALPEVVGDAGVLVPPGDVEALTRAMATLLADAERREHLGEAARRRICTEFDWEDTARETLALYRRAIDHANGNGGGNSTGDGDE
ncbi:MAG TPA: glycosyltransferase family 4 protein [Halobacteriales archaeon]|nr:glycosyltransferase family 4 protein [Halobacteriales archaeon]